MGQNANLNWIWIKLQVSLHQKVFADTLTQYLIVAHNCLYYHPELVLVIFRPTNPDSFKLYRSSKALQAKLLTQSFNNALESPV